MSERSAIRNPAQRAADAGHRIHELPLGPTKIHALINEGKLRAAKSGRATIVTNWPEYLASLPPAGKAA